MAQFSSSRIYAKMMTLEQALAWRLTLRSSGIRLVATNGCFDLLHRGHAEYLMKARERGGALVVLVNSDASVRALKGPTRPVTHERDRALLLASLAFVDAAVIFDSIRCDQIYLKLQPDIYVKGGDYTLDTMNGEERAALQEVGADIQFISFVDGYSTTSLLEKSRG